MGKIAAVAMVTVRDILRRKILYFVLLILLIVLYFSLQGNAWVKMAEEAGELDSANKMRSEAVILIIQFFTNFGEFFSLFFASTALSADIKERTLTAILARPVERWQYILGKWIGVVGFVSAFISAGVVLGLALAGIYDVHLPTVFWLGILESYVRVVFFSAVCVGFSVRLPPILAGTTAFFLTFLPKLVESQLTHPNPIARSAAAAVYYLSPAVMPVELLNLGKELRDPSYGLYAKILLENTLYAMAVLLLGCRFFMKRDVPVK